MADGQSLVVVLDADGRTAREVVVEAAQERLRLGDVALQVAVRGGHPALEVDALVVALFGPRLDDLALLGAGIERFRDAVDVAGALHRAILVGAAAAAAAAFRRVFFRVR